MEKSGKWTAEDERAHLALGVPEMLPGSVAFECIGDSNVFDGCYAGAAGCEKLYEGDGRRVEWIGSRASGGAGMAADAERLFQQP